jgi:hypothetical protein
VIRWRVSLKYEPIDTDLPIPGTVQPSQGCSIMSKLRQEAAEAKQFLGEEGSLDRVAAVATLYQGDVGPEEWVVESFDASGDGGMFITVFAGPCARERAEEYAKAKYSGLRLHEPDLPPYR